MGGKNKAAQDVLENFAGPAESFFGNARVPASIIMGSSLTALFALPKFRSSNDRTKLEHFFIRMYRIFSWSSFVLALNVVVTSTVATTSMLHGQFDPMAETAYLLLKREFEYEFISVQWSMIMSLLLFIGVTTVRLFLEFDLFRDPTRRDIAMFVLLSALSLMAHLLSHVNTTLYCWSNFGAMTIDLFRLIATMTMEEPSPMRLLAIVSAVGAMYYGYKCAAAKNKEKVE